MPSETTISPWFFGVHVYSRRESNLSLPSLAFLNGDDDHHHQFQGSLTLLFSMPFYLLLPPHPVPFLLALVVHQAST